jgi:CrcB protein
MARGSSRPVESSSERDDAAVTQARPAHQSVANIALVAVGGAVGTGLRFGLSLLVPLQHGLPVAIFVVNVIGAFVLGLLLELLADTGLDIGWSRRIRLGVGTGLLGGFTTYSALAADTVTLGFLHPGLAAGYGLGTVVLGGLASTAGIALSRHWLRPALTTWRCGS